jgi:hypothetical protein
MTSFDIVVVDVVWRGIELVEERGIGVGIDAVVIGLVVEDGKSGVKESVVEHGKRVAFLMF